MCFILVSHRGAERENRMKPRKQTNGHEYTMRTKSATNSTSQMSFRHSIVRRKQLETFAIEDGTALTPVLRNAFDLYVHLRHRFGKDAFSMKTIGARAAELVGA